MASNKTYTAKESGALYIQPDGPNTRSYYLACHEVDDFDEDLGSINELIQCFNGEGLDSPCKTLVRCLCTL